MAEPDSTLVCVGCGYSLEGLEPDGLCPECGLAIAATLKRQRTLPDPGAFSLRIALGLQWLGFARLLLVAAVATVAVLSHMIVELPILTAALLGFLTFSIAEGIAWRYLAVQDNRHGAETPGYRASLYAKWMNIAIIAGTAGTLTLIAFKTQEAAMPLVFLLAMAVLLKSSVAVGAISDLAKWYTGRSMFAIVAPMSLVLSLMVVVLIPPVILTPWVVFAMRVALLRLQVQRYRLAHIGQPKPDTDNRG